MEHGRHHARRACAPERTAVRVPAGTATDTCDQACSVFSNDTRADVAGWYSFSTFAHSENKTLEGAGLRRYAVAEKTRVRLAGRNLSRVAVPSILLRGQTTGVEDRARGGPQLPSGCSKERPTNMDRQGLAPDVRREISHLPPYPTGGTNR